MARALKGPHPVSRKVVSSHVRQETGSRSEALGVMLRASAPGPVPRPAGNPAACPWICPMRLNVVITLLALAAPAFAGGQFNDWRSGDLVFQESRSPQAAAIRAATGSAYTHMGIVEVTEGGIFVIEAGRVVGATPLRDFIARGTSGEYSVYRLANLEPEAAVAVLAASRSYFGLPYDIFFRLAPDAIYCSELPHYAFRSIGRNLGTVQTLGTLAINHPEARGIFLSRWQDHPDCANIDQQACWNVIQSQEIVTPASIAGDAALEQVFSNMKP